MSTQRNYRKKRIIRKNKSQRKTRTKRNSSTKRRKKRSLLKKVSQSKYQQLLRKKRLSTKEKRVLHDNLLIRYCKCLKGLESTRGSAAYPICMNSVYKQRNIQPPSNASSKCYETFFVG